MICTLAFFAGDKPNAANLAQWINQLGGVKHHDCLLVVDAGTTPAGVVEHMHQAFKSLTIIRSEPVDSKGTWGDGTTDASGPNEMWLTAATYIQHRIRKRWFWLESDAIPTRSTWLDEIEAEDKRGAKAFTGAYVDIPPHEPHMTGIAVYPPDVASHSLAMAIPGKIAWDYAGRKETVDKGKAHFTDLIQHEYRIHGESPTFPTQESLSVIKARTAVFHRCKDSTLIDRLRERNTYTSFSPKIGDDVEIQPRRAHASEDLLISVNRVAILESENLQLKQTIKMMQEELDKREKPPTIKKTRTMSPEHKAKLGAALAKARATKADKAKAK